MMRGFGYLMIGLMFTLLSCRDEKIINDGLKIEEQKITKPIINKEYFFQISNFIEILDYPKINDTAAFVFKLSQNCHFPNVELYPAEGENKVKETINYFKKIKINGSPNYYYLIEYDWHADMPNSSFPWKYQLLFNSEGRLIKKLDCLKVELRTILDGELPFLFCLSSTAHGNGGHGLFQFKDDSLVNILDDFKSNFIRTYDADPCNNLNKPAEFQLKLEDKNQDGYNDIVFYGQVIYSKDNNCIGAVPESEITIPVSLEYIYNDEEGQFVCREDYGSKYSELAN